MVTRKQKQSRNKAEIFWWVMCKGVGLGGGHRLRVQERESMERHKKREIMADYS